MARIGFMLNSPHTFPSWRTFGQELAALARIGYAGVELALRDPSKLDADRLGKSLAYHGLHLCSIGTGASYFDDGLCLTSTDPSIRAAAVIRLRAHVDLAARFGSVIVIGQMQGLRADEPDRETANARSVDTLRQVAEHAEAKGVLLTLEPINRFEVGHNHTAAEVVEVVDRVGSAALTVMLDTFHINIEESSLDGPVRLFGDRLGYVHVFENHRGLFGTGHVDLGKILRATIETGYQGYWVFGDFSANSTEVRAVAVMDFLRRARLIA